MKNTDSGIFSNLIAKAPSAPLSEILPQALQLALAINNKEFKKWISLELNGYWSSNPDLTEDVTVPEYRTVPGQYSDDYGRPLVITDPKMSFVNEIRLRYGVSELEEMAKKPGLLTIRDPSMNELIESNLKIKVTNYSFSPSTILSVLTGIRSKFIENLHSIKSQITSEATAGKAMNLSLADIQGLHPLVLEVSGRLYRDGYYRQAILDTYIALVQAVKDKSGRHDLDGTGLMQTVFSPKNPIIIASEDPDEQMGYMWMFSGAVMGIRNPKAHKLIPQNDPQVTFEWLSFASVLLRVLDKSTLKQAQPSS